jgi:heme/copper-type cytochrome/quinol oxidase subunit 1
MNETTSDTPLPWLVILASVFLFGGIGSLFGDCTNTVSVLLDGMIMVGQLSLLVGIGGSVGIITNIIRSTRNSPHRHKRPSLTRPWWAPFGGVLGVSLLIMIGLLCIYFGQHFSGLFDAPCVSGFTLDMSG